MPILAFGRHTVHTNVPEGSLFVRGQTTSFFFFPLQFSLWIVAAGIGLVTIQTWRRVDRAFSHWKYLILLPGLAWVLLPILVKSPWTLYGAPPLGAVTLTFLLWRLFRVRRWYLAAPLVVLAGAAGCLYTGMVMLGSWLDLIHELMVYLYCLISGAIMAVPVTTLRIAVRKGLTRRRLVLGTIAAFALSVTVLSFVCLATGSFAELTYVLPGFVGIPLLGALLLVRWNRWARDVITGAMFRPREAASPSGDSALRPMN